MSESVVVLSDGSACMCIECLSRSASGHVAGYERLRAQVHLLVDGDAQLLLCDSELLTRAPGEGVCGRWRRCGWGWWRCVLVLLLLLDELGVLGGFLVVVVRHQRLVS